MTTPEASKTQVAEEERVPSQVEGTTLVFELGQLAIEDTRQLLNEMARQSAGRGRSAG